MSKRGKDKMPKYERIHEDAHPAIFGLLHELVAKFHANIVDAEIGLVWINNVEADKDGHLLFGRAKLVGALEKEFHDADFVIQLNKRAWGLLPDQGKTALLDHELSHCGVTFHEKTGAPKWRMVKHDVEDFTAIVRRHGLWHSGMEVFVNAAMRREQTPLFVEKVNEGTGEVVEVNGG